MSAETDSMLRRLLAAPERAPDEAFALRIQRLVLAEERLRAARRAAWRRFGRETMAAAALIAAFLLVEYAAPADSRDIVPLFGPAAIGVLLLALFVAAVARGDTEPAAH